MSSATELLSAAVNMHVGLFYNSNSESVACLFVVSAKFLYTECAFPPRSSFLSKVNGAGEENRAPTYNGGRQLEIVYSNRGGASAKNSRKNTL